MEMDVSAFLFYISLFVKDINVIKKLDFCDERINKRDRTVGFQMDKWENGNQLFLLRKKIL